MEGQIASPESAVVVAEVEVHSQMFQQMEVREALVVAAAVWVMGTKITQFNLLEVEVLVEVVAQPHGEEMEGMGVLVVAAAGLMEELGEMVALAVAELPERFQVVLVLLEVGILQMIMEPAAAAQSGEAS